MRWLEKIPLGPMILAAIFMGLAPFVPQPHLWEKVNMLINGSLTKPIDMFDLLWHSALPILVIVKIVTARRTQPDSR